MTRRFPVALLAASLASGVVSACGAAPAARPPAPAKAASAATGTPSSPAPTAKKPLQHVTLLLDFQLSGYQSPLFLGVQKGFYKQAGLDVKIIPGKGSVSTAQQVGHDNYNFGFVSAQAVASAISKGVPEKMVADFMQISPVAIVALAGSHIAKPADLLGKTLGAAPGTAAYQLLPAFLASTHLSPGRIHVDTVATTALVSTLLSRKAAAIATYDINTVPILAAKGFKTTELAYGQYGVPGLAQGIAVNDAYLKAHPATVTAFVHATQRAWAYARTHMAEALRAEKAIGGKEPPGALDQLKILYQKAHTGNTRGKPLGWMSAKDWTETLGIIHKYLKISPIKPLNDYYTNRFIAQSVS